MLCDIRIIISGPKENDRQSQLSDVLNNKALQEISWSRLSKECYTMLYRK